MQTARLYLCGSINNRSQLANSNRSQRLTRSTCPVRTYIARTEYARLSLEPGARRSPGGQQRAKNECMELSVLASTAVRRSKGLWSVVGLWRQTQYNPRSRTEKLDAPGTQYAVWCQYQTLAVRHSFLHVALPILYPRGEPRPTERERERQFSSI